MAVLFDGTELVSTTYMPRFVKHESVADRLLTTHPRAREDGEVLIADRYGMKTIRIQGVLKGSSQSDLESKIDAFTELFSRPEKNLDIDWAGGTRRYVATCRSHTFDRDHFHLSIVPWAAEFTILSGAGKATSVTTALNAHGVTVTTPGTDSFIMSGSKPARPVITLTGASFSGVQRGIEYKNTDTGERIVFCRASGAFGATDRVKIDCEARTVSLSEDGGTTYLPQSFYGLFPRFRIGTNNVQITVGDIVNQSSAETALAQLSTMPGISATTHRLAQSFAVPYSDATFRSASLALRKTGTPGDLTVEIYTDDGGKPGSGITNASATISHASVGTTLSYVTVTFANVFTLTANTKYWLVIYGAATLDGSNYYSWGGQPGNYPKGKCKTSTNSGSTYTETAAGLGLGFRILMGGISAASTVNHTVAYTPQYL